MMRNKKKNQESLSDLLFVSHDSPIKIPLKKALIIKEEEEALLRNFIKNIPAAVAVFDKNLNYIITSDRWIEETHPSIESIIGKNHYDVVPDIPSEWRKLHLRCLKGEHLRCEEDQFNRQDGTVEWLRWEILPWYKTEHIIGGMIMFIEHITERKNMEKKMNEMIKALNHSNAELEKFAHICAHDLSEPLRTIGSYYQLIRNDLKETLSSQAQTYLDHVKTSLEQAEDLINGILEYSQFGSFILNKKSCSLQKIFNSVKLMLKKKIEDKKAYIYSDPLPVISGDKILLSRLFQNLLTNSLKFNDTDIPIIYITVQKKKNFWVFNVEDNGIGIDPKYHNKVFDLFKKLHHKSTYEGTGLGLSLCKKIVEIHGGKIWLTSSLHHGSCFSFSLPSS
jgi:PAS domain S-box-containing protein